MNDNLSNKLLFFEGRTNRIYLNGQWLISILDGVFAIFHSIFRLFFPLYHRSFQGLVIRKRVCCTKKKLTNNNKIFLARKKIQIHKIEYNVETYVLMTAQKEK